MPADIDQTMLLRALRATWPPKSQWREGALLCADGAGGGKRVSATILAGSLDGAEDRIAEAPLVMVPTGAQDLEAHLAASHKIVDPTLLFAAPALGLAAKDREIYLADAPVATMRHLWDTGGVGANRLAVMARAQGSSTYIAARSGAKTVGVGFVAIADDVAMLHAVHIDDNARRSGHGSRITRTAADWAVSNGARILGVAAVAQNRAACGLYVSLGMKIIGGYHYRALQ